MTLQISIMTIVLATLLAWIVVVDLRHMIIPDLANLTLAGTGLIATVVLASEQLVAHVMAGVIGYTALLLLSAAYEAARGHQGLGGGDVKMFGAAGCWLGIAGLPSVLLVATISGLLASVVAVLVGRSMSGTSRLAFGPHLAVGVLFTWLLGPLIIG